jgi:hypothetical protein
MDQAEILHALLEPGRMEDFHEKGNYPYSESAGSISIVRLRIS